MNFRAPMYWSIRSIFQVLVTFNCHILHKSTCFHIQVVTKDFGDIRVICKIKQMKPWVYSQTLSLWELTQSHPSFLMLKLSSSKSGVGLLKTGFLACPTKVDGLNLTLYRPIWDLGQQILCACLILNPKILSKFEKWKEKVPKFHPTFKIGSNTWEANKLLIESILKEGSIPRFHPSLREFPIILYFQAPFQSLYIWRCF